MNIFYYDVAVNLPIRQCFTYKSITSIKKGTRVVVPFGKKTIVGVVVRKIAKPNSFNKSGAIKEIISTNEQFVCFDKPIFNTILWASDYYHHPIGDVIFSFIPTVLRNPGNKIIAPTNEISTYKLNEDDKSFNLTKEQEINLTKLKKIKGFKPSLIYGVTGSGKTEIYLRLAEEIVKENKAILILVPEINLTPQLVSRFQNRFNGDIGVYHSRMTPGQRLKVWLRSKFGEIKIVIGTRSSVLMPLKNIGAIIVDEEHDQSYKQSEGFKFSGRDLAIKRAQLEDIPVYLGSATPLFKHLNLLKKKKYKKFDLLRRVDGKKPPKLIPLDITNSPLVGNSIRNNEYYWINNKKRRASFNFYK